eukprot:2440074-Ditylum_brightwellii.AAC.1
MYGDNKVHYNNKVCIFDFWYDDEAYDDNEAFDDDGAYYDYGAYYDNKINSNDENDDDDLLLDNDETYRDNDCTSKVFTKEKILPQ